MRPFCDIFIVLQLHSYDEFKQQALHPWTFLYTPNLNNNSWFNSGNACLFFFRSLFYKTHCIEYNRPMYMYMYGAHNVYMIWGYNRNRSLHIAYFLNIWNWAELIYLLRNPLEAFRHFDFILKERSNWSAMKYWIKWLWQALHIKHAYPGVNDD